MKNKENIVLVSSTNFYALKESPSRISYSEIVGDKSEKSKWKKIKLEIHLDDVQPKNDEIMYSYGDLWKLLVKKEEFQK